MRGLYAVTPDSMDTSRLVAQVRSALSGGARLVQYRNKTASQALRFEQALALSSLCSKVGAALIVNDHVEVALACDAAGVHLGGEDGSAIAARTALGPHKIIGISCYDSLARAHTAVRDGADYVAFGSFFPSHVKPAAVRATVELLASVRRELDVPIAAIGGITSDNGGELVRAGADALAVISAIFGAAGARAMQAAEIEAAAARFSSLFNTDS